MPCENLSETFLIFFPASAVKIRFNEKSLEMSQSNSSYSHNESSRWPEANDNFVFPEQTSNFEPFEQLDLFSPFLNPQQQFKRFQDQQEQVSLTNI